MNTVLIQSTAALVLAIACVIAAQHVLYAKTLPGEGFTAGALVVLAFLLLGLVRGYDRVRKRFPPRLFHRGMLLGLSLLVGVAFGPVLVGKGMLETLQVKILAIELGSTLAFDVGLFLVTVCSLVLAVNSLRSTLP